jgi:cytochrome c2
MSCAGGRERGWVTYVLLTPAAVLLLLTGISSCHGPAARSTAVFGGNPRRGEQAIVAFGCGACHTIDGVRGAAGQVGPPRTGIRHRTMLAGELPNTPENMVTWIRDPQDVEPGTAMRDLGVGEQAARDIAAYLLVR